MLQGYFLILCSVIILYRVKYHIKNFFNKLLEVKKMIF